MSEVPVREEISALFAAAIELPAAGRTAFVRDADVSESVRGEVASLLAVYEHAKSQAEGLEPELAARILDGEHGGEADVRRDRSDLEGRLIGPYRLLRELGRGGMGVVYLAERADGAYEQQVAFKLLPPSLRSEALAQRFALERQILARLEHPGIARLLDGGVAEHGEPYLVMEYVDGESITEWCDERRLGIRQRLGLFLRVCDAVQYAHGHLIVHRDLKPSNILVTDENEVKLLDFGIAKLLTEGGDAEATALTRLGLRPYTPGYAAPEQLRGEPVTVVTDVYGLGVLLYELLCGQRPHDADTSGRRSKDQWVPPTRPSVRLARAEVSGDDGDTGSIDAAEIAARRDSRPDRLRRRLVGDLDILTLKALREESTERYESAQALADDIRRHLDAQPITARTPGRAYRIGKFVQRYTVGVALGGIALLALLIGLAGTAWQAAVASRERDRARQEAAKAKEVKDFVLDLFAVSDPNTARGELVTARELLDRGTLRIRSELDDQPEVRAEMMSVLGDIYRQLGLYETAQPLLEEALALRRETLGAEHPAVTASLGSLAALWYAKGDYQAADRSYRRALELEEELSGTGSPQVARWLNGLSLAVRAQGRYDEAADLARRSLALRRKLLGPAHADVAESLTNVAVPLYLKREYPEAEALYREALAMRRGLQGDDHLEVAAVQNRLALLLRRQEQYDEAEELFARAIATYRQRLGDDHPDVAMVISNTAQLHQSRGDAAPAERLYREALAIQRRALAPDHPDLAITLNNLGGLLVSRGDYGGAEPFLRETLAIWTKTHGELHAYVAIALGNLGENLRHQGEFDAAISHLRRSLAIKRELYGEKDDRVEEARELVTRAERDRAAE